MLSPPRFTYMFRWSSESIANLRELAQMRSDGLLSDEEFQRAKEKFLA